MEIITNRRKEHAPLSRVFCLSIFLLALLSVGCTSIQQNNKAILTETNASDYARVIQEPINTTNLSFYRNASDVFNSNTEIPKRINYTFSNITTANGSLIVYYFYSPYCPASQAIAPEMGKLQKKYPQVTFLRYDITTQNGTWAYQDFAASYNLSYAQRMVPQVLVNNTIITDRFNINDTLEGIITSFISASDG